MGLPFVWGRPFLYIKCGSDNDDEENKITLTRADRPPPSLDFIILCQNQETNKKEGKPVRLALLIIPLD